MNRTLNDGAIIHHNEKISDTCTIDDHYFVVRFENGLYLLCKTDYLLRGEKPSFTDLWRVSEDYLQRGIKKGTLTIISNENETN